MAANKEVISGISWSYSEKLISQCASLLISIILARLLAPSYYGTISIATVFLTICNVLADGGFGNALVQKKRATDTDFSSIFWFSSGISVVLYVILFIVAEPIAQFYENPEITLVLRVLGIKVVFSAINSVQIAYIQKNMLFRKQFIVTFCSVLLSGIFGIAAAYMNFGVWALVIQTLIAAVLTTIMNFFVIGWWPHCRISASSIRSLWGYGSKVLLSTITSTLKDNIRSLIIGKEFTSSDLAYYNQGQKYPALLVTDIVESFGRVMFPVMSDYQNDEVAVKKLLRKSIRTSSLILSPCVAGLIAVADTFVETILTSKWLPCVPYIRIISIVYIARPLSTVLQKGLLSIGKSGVILLHEVVTSLITVVLLLMSVFVLDSIYFIAWSYVAVMVVGIAIQMYYAQKYLNYQYWEMATDCFPTLLLSGLMCVAVYALGSLQFPAVLKLLLQIAAGVVIFILMAEIVKLKAYREIKAILQRVLGSLKNRRR